MGHSIENSSTAIILGAGFSFCAGLPLTSHLFDTSELPPSRSNKDKRLMQDVLASYKRWSTTHPNEGAEQWLATLYADREHPLPELLNGTSWTNAIQFFLRRLTGLKSAHPRPYYYGISRYEVNPIHRAFWEKVEATFGTGNIISLNYDILVERALHQVSGGKSLAPRFRYGGFPYKQVVKQWKKVSAPDGWQNVELGSEWVIYKLHGSLNWAWEPHSRDMKIHDDVRAAFRNEDSGVAAIIPPIPEKEMPEKFQQIWLGARECLKESEVWLVCGYSRPDYDEALIRLFDECYAEGIVRRIIIIDPCSNDLAERWRVRSVERAVDIVCLDALPNALNADWV